MCAETSSLSLTNPPAFPFVFRVSEMHWRKNRDFIGTAFALVLEAQRKARWKRHIRTEAALARHTSRLEQREVASSKLSDDNDDTLLGSACVFRSNTRRALAVIV
jgi:hypothetical protein